MDDFVFDKGRTCCFTGHREIPADKREYICDNICGRIRALAAQGYTDFIAGGALGFDTLCAICVRRVKNEPCFDNIRLHIFVPCPDQTRGWSADDKRIYQLILEKADSVRYISDSYYQGCMHKRNRAMVDESSALIYYCTRESGGSAYTLRYAREKGLEVLSTM